jgi:hypothetical protein
VAGKQITDRDPLKGREAQLDKQKHLPGKYPSGFLPNKKPRSASDEWYHPHKGGEKK